MFVGEPPRGKRQKYMYQGVSTCSVPYFSSSILQTCDQFFKKTVEYSWGHITSYLVLNFAPIDANLLLIDVIPVLRWSTAIHLGSLCSRPNGRYAPSKGGRNIIMIPYIACYTWSHFVTTGHKWLSHIQLQVLAWYWKLVTDGHNWSHLVTTGHKFFLGHIWSHWYHSCIYIPKWWGDISPDVQMDIHSHIEISKTTYILP